MDYARLDIRLDQNIVKLVAEIDEFKGRWEALKNLAPQRLNKLRKVATIESIGSSTRIEGSKLSDAQVETLLSGLKTKSFQSRDEQEVAGYAETMDLVFQAWEDMPITENHIRQLHQTLLRHSTKDDWSRLCDDFTFRHAARNGRACRMGSKGHSGGSISPTLNRRNFHCEIPCYPPIPRWEWQTVTCPHNAHAFARRLRLRSLRFSGKCSGGEQGAVLQRSKTHSKEPRRHARLGAVDWLFPARLEEAKDHSRRARQGRERRANHQRRTAPAFRGDFRVICESQEANCF